MRPFDDGRATIPDCRKITVSPATEGSFSTNRTQLWESLERLPLGYLFNMLTEMILKFLTVLFATALLITALDPKPIHWRGSG